LPAARVEAMDNYRRKRRTTGTHIRLTPAARALIRLCGALAAVAPACAWALVTGELADQVADVLAVVVIIIVPLIGIYAFWKIHILPEEIAEKRQHPQKDAIRMLCLLSLVFGGLLWPIAWLWAYTKPTLHKLAYGTDKHEDAEKEAAHAAEPAEPEAVASAPGPRIDDSEIALKDHLATLRWEIDRLSDDGAAPEDIALLKRDVARIEQKLSPPPRRGAH
jgi:hypothetical protein